MIGFTAFMPKKGTSIWLIALDRRSSYNSFEQQATYQICVLSFRIFFTKQEPEREGWQVLISLYPIFLIVLHYETLDSVFVRKLCISK